MTNNNFFFITLGRYSYISSSICLYGFCTWLRFQNHSQGQIFLQSLVAVLQMHYPLSLCKIHKILFEIQI